MAPAAPKVESRGQPARGTDVSSRERCSTRDRLLHLAGPVFAARGFDAVTVRELATEANVNVAAVGYHFGDKLGLYRAVIEGIRSKRDQLYPCPNPDEPDPCKRLTKTVRNLLCRMSSDQSGWETQLLMREIQRPTPAFEHIVRVIFRPQFDHLISNLGELSSFDLPTYQLEQIALGIVGQCTYHATGSGMIQILISEENRRQHFGIDSFTVHIVASTLTTLQNGDIREHQSIVAKMLDQQNDSD